MWNHHRRFHRNQHTCHVQWLSWMLLSLKARHMTRSFRNKIDDLTRAVERLKHLQSHDALVILKNCPAIPKLLYLLRTSQCGYNPLLRQFDNTLWTVLVNILNVDISNDQWLQASLPVGDGGLGIQSAEMLAPSAYLASAASTFLLQQSILPDSIGMQGDQPVASAPTHQNHCSKYDTVENVFVMILFDFSTMYLVVNADGIIL